MLLRKAFVWGNGLEEDRQNFGSHGKRTWVDRVSRFVSLATINRGWSIDPRPSKMDLLSTVHFGSANVWLGLARVGN